ncbi:hypothetical protein R3P38DRAFT_2862835 [Favolaschia claudopus]|uniref:Uncharacterized protein n=1 Tax=Favolaschia claudopus TaxID=2862362 RepID=A0AAW0DFC9_9AGAR
MVAESAPYRLNRAHREAQTSAESPERFSNCMHFVSRKRSPCLSDLPCLRLSAAHISLKRRILLDTTYLSLLLPAARRRVHSKLYFLRNFCLPTCLALHLLSSSPILLRPFLFLISQCSRTDRLTLTTTRNNHAGGATEAPRISHKLLSDVSLPNTDCLILTTTHNDNTDGTAVNAVPRLTHKILSEHDTSVTLAVGHCSPIGLGHPSTSRRRPSSIESKSTAGPTASIGLGHPSKRRVSYIEADTTACPKQTTPTKRTRIQSSTVKRRTKRFPRRELFDIPEDHEEAEHLHAPVAASESSSGSTSGFADRRCAIPTLPASPRCANPQFSATSSNITVAALAPRSSSTGQPLAGPTQVLSPRLLFPATMAGAPNFQSLDGAMMNIVSVSAEAAGEEDGAKW